MLFYFRISWIVLMYPAAMDHSWMIIAMWCYNTEWWTRLAWSVQIIPTWLCETTLKVSPYYNIESSSSVSLLARSVNSGVDLTTSTQPRLQLSQHKHKEKCFLFLKLCLFHKCEQAREGACYIERKVWYWSHDRIRF